MIDVSYLYLVYLFATKFMTDKAMTTNSLDLFCFTGFYGDTSRNYFIFHFILLYTLLNKKTDLLTFSLFIDTLHSLDLKIAKSSLSTLQKFNTH